MFIGIISTYTKPKTRRPYPVHHFDKTRYSLGQQVSSGHGVPGDNGVSKPADIKPAVKPAKGGSESMMEIDEREWVAVNAVRG